MKKEVASKSLGLEEKGKEKEDESGFYEVEEILAERKRARGKEYLVRWKGYSPSHDSWVKESDLRANELLAEYHRRKGEGRKLKGGVM